MSLALGFGAFILTVSHMNLQCIKYTIKMLKLALAEASFRECSERQVHGRRHRKTAP